MTREENKLEPASDGTKAFLRQASIEMTAKDRGLLAVAAQSGLRSCAVFIPYLPGETSEDRLRAAVEVRQLGFEPVPHISARRLTSAAELDSILTRFRETAGVRSVLLVGGDPAIPSGPFADSLTVIEDGAFSRNGIEAVGLAGHPEGHPAMPGAAATEVLRRKIEALEIQGLGTEIVTQFSFDADVVARWLCDLRRCGIGVPVAIGLPGPAKVSTLLKFAARCGVGASAKVVTRYGLSLTRLLSRTGPEAFIEQLLARTGPTSEAGIRAHLYPFGGFAETTIWLDDCLRRCT